MFATSGTASSEEAFAGAGFFVGDEGTDGSLFGVSAPVELVRGSSEGVDADPQFLRVLTLVDGETEVGGDRLAFLDRVVDPAVPSALGIDKDELRIVVPDPHDNGFGS